MDELNITCTRCGELKPKSDFNGRHRRCTPCRMDEQREYRAGERRGPKGKILEPLEPATETDQEDEDEETPVAIAALFQDRPSTETYMKTEMSKIMGEYDTILKSAKEMLKRAVAKGDVGEVAKQQTVIRSTIKDKQTMLASLRKEYELLTNLDKPMSEDPKFTPVILELHLDVPERAMVPKRHFLDPDDIQDGQDIS